MRSCEIFAFVMVLGSGGMVVAEERFSDEDVSETELPKEKQKRRALLCLLNEIAISPRPARSVSHLSIMH